MIPILGTGAAGFEFQTGAQVVCETVNEYAPELLTDVRVFAYSAPEHETVREIATDVQFE